MKGSITDVAGIKVGHYTDTKGVTGCTVILCEGGAVGGVDVRGSAPGTRETDLLRPGNLVQEAQAVLLSGGSAFGLNAAGGVMAYLEERGIGFPTRVARVPIVPAAILFDLGIGDPKARPGSEAGYKACLDAKAEAPDEGSVGAGTGATVAKALGMERAVKSGISTASLKVGSVVVGAIVAVNAVGDILDYRRAVQLAGPRREDGKGFHRTMDILAQGRPVRVAPATNTTIGVVATNAALTKEQANKVAQMAHDGLARSINPVHTMGDGDVLFALATGENKEEPNVTLIGALAAEVVATAVVEAVLAARSLGGVPALHDLRVSP